MSAGTLMLRLCLGLLSVCVPLGSAVQINITAEHGKKVILPCQVPNNSKPIVAVEWSRPDLEPDFVLFYRDGHFDSFYQHPSFKNHVYLQDSEMKHGNVSLILENAMTDDEGIYECRVRTRMGHRKRAHLSSDPIGTINMTVVPSANIGGNTENGGKEDGARGDPALICIALLLYRKSRA
ncbi:GTP-binding protein SAR1 [Sarotherodon galilaeus]